MLEICSLVRSRMSVMCSGAEGHKKEVNDLGPSSPNLGLGVGVPSLACSMCTKLYMTYFEQKSLVTTEHH